jgi:hypothetical protein
MLKKLGAGLPFLVEGSRVPHNKSIYGCREENWRLFLQSTAGTLKISAFYLNAIKFNIKKI